MTDLNIEVKKIEKRLGVMLSKFKKEHINGVYYKRKYVGVRYTCDIDFDTQIEVNVYEFFGKKSNKFMAQYIPSKEVVLASISKCENVLAASINNPNSLLNMVKRFENIKYLAEHNPLLAAKCIITCNEPQAQETVWLLEHINKRLNSEIFGYEILLFMKAKDVLLGKKLMTISYILSSLIQVDDIITYDSYKEENGSIVIKGIVPNNDVIVIPKKNLLYLKEEIK